MCKVIHATLQNKPDVCPHCGKNNLYQQLLSALKRKDTAAFKGIIHGEYKNISGYFKTALKTCRQYEEYIINSMMCNYTNGVIEGINNKIKAVKRMAFGYRSESFSYFV